MVDLSAFDNHYTINKLPWNTNYDEILQIKVLQQYVYGCLLLKPCTNHAILGHLNNSDQLLHYSRPPLQIYQKALLSKK